MAKLTTPADLDRAVLGVLSQLPNEMTYVIRNMLDMAGYYGHRPKRVESSQVRQSCRRLEKKGYAKEVPSIYMRQKCWAITDAGLRALSEHKGE